LANRRTFASVLDQLAFLQAMAVKLGRKSAALGLEELRNSLTQMKGQDHEKC
jgi:hypothetical protein